MCGAPIQDGDQFCMSCGTKVEVQNIHKDTFTICQNCNTQFNSTFGVCPNCGVVYETTENNVVIETSNEIPLDDGILRCPDCGTKIVRPIKKDIETESIITQKETDLSSADSCNPFKGLIVCAVIILISALILPIYYYEGGTKFSIFLLGFKEIDRHFGMAFEEPLIRCNTIVFACLALTSIINITLAYKRKHKGTMFCLFVALCAMIVYPIYVYDNLPDLNTIRTVSIGFFVIIIAVIAGMMFSYKCSKDKNSGESEKMP